MAFFKKKKASSVSSDFLEGDIVGSPVAPQQKAGIGSELKTSSKVGQQGSTKTGQSCAGGSTRWFFGRAKEQKYSTDESSHGSFAAGRDHGVGSLDGWEQDGARSRRGIGEDGAGEGVRVAVPMPFNRQLTRLNQLGREPRLILPLWNIPDLGTFDNTVAKTIPTASEQAGADSDSSDDDSPLPPDGSDMPSWALGKRKGGLPSVPNPTLQFGIPDKTNGSKRTVAKPGNEGILPAAAVEALKKIDRGLEGGLEDIDWGSWELKKASLAETADDAEIEFPPLDLRAGQGSAGLLWEGDSRGLPPAARSSNDGAGRSSAAVDGPMELPGMRDAAGGGQRWIVWAEDKDGTGRWMRSVPDDQDKEGSRWEVWSEEWGGWATAEGVEFGQPPPGISSGPPSRVGSDRESAGERLVDEGVPGEDSWDFSTQLKQQNLSPPLTPIHHFATSISRTENSWGAASGDRDSLRANPQTDHRSEFPTSRSVPNRSPARSPLESPSGSSGELVSPNLQRGSGVWSAGQTPLPLSPASRPLPPVWDGPPPMGPSPPRSPVRSPRQMSPGRLPNESPPAGQGGGTDRGAAGSVAQRRAEDAPVDVEVGSGNPRTVAADWPRSRSRSRAVGWAHGGKLRWELGGGTQEVLLETRAWAGCLRDSNFLESLIGEGSEV